MSGHLSWLEAGVVGTFQGVAELFSISSLGHTLLLPALVGGSRKRDLSVSTPESLYLAFIVGLHVATAIALVIFFRKDWARQTVGLSPPAALEAINPLASCDRRPGESVDTYLTRAAARAGRGPLFTREADVIHISARSGS